MKVILADDHALFREGMQYLLMRLSQDISILQANSHDSAVKLLLENPDSDLALVDLHMPGRESSLSGLTELLVAAKTIPVVVLSGSESLYEIHQVITAGAKGFIPKQEHSDVMLCALQLVLTGSVYVPPLMLKGNSNEQNHLGALTPKQLQVLQQLCKGHSNKVIAKTMHVTEATVKCHTTAIFRELDVGSRTQAIAIAKTRGLVAG
ncbi:MAG: response regulator transcription factor [Gallionella sp.]